MRTWILGVCLAATAVVSAQQAPAPTDSFNFEVATLKQNKSGERGGGIRRLPGGRVTVTNMAARQLITFAYQLGQFQLTGGPSWLADDKFDITAKMEGNPEWEGPGSGKPDPIQLAMRKLLAERFKLKLHAESRDLDAYALVMVKPGVNGPRSNRRRPTARQSRNRRVRESRRRRRSPSTASCPAASWDASGRFPSTASRCRRPPA